MLPVSAPGGYLFLPALSTTLHQHWEQSERSAMESVHTLAHVLSMAVHWNTRACYASLSQSLVLLLLPLACCVSQPELLRPPQYKLVWVRGESLDHPEDAGTKAKVRLRVRTEPGK